MKILVAVKRVIDYNVQIRVKEDNSGVVTENVKMSTNPPDDNAIEEAVKIKESGKAKESHFWFGKSAELGNPEAHLALATNFILGRGEKKDLTLAHVSCNLATLLSKDIGSISRSIQLRTELETKMSADQIKIAEQLSRKCIEKKFKECMNYAELDIRQ